MRTPEPRRSPKARCLPNPGRAKQIALFLLNHRVKEVPSRKTFQNQRLVRLRSLTGIGKLGGHYRHHTYQNTSRRRATGTRALPLCKSTPNMGAPIRHIPTPALSITPIRITRLERTLCQRLVTRCRCIAIISPWTLSRHPSCMNRRCTSLHHHHQ